MYEQFFGFRDRPFASTPSADGFVANSALRDSLNEAVRCLRTGEGIAVITGPAGSGKTTFCRQVARELQETCRTVLLESANVGTRRGLLQSILFELGVEYTGLSEQEARLRLLETAVNLVPEGRGIVLIIDEAHQLAPKLLEELRTLTNHAASGRPLIRVMLAGNFDLELTLIEPEMDAFNHRIRCQHALEPLTREESARFVAQRLEMATDESDAPPVFTPQALDLICTASDGNPRCLTQLCDHALVLAYVAEERPIDVGIVRNALDDLKQLPLCWNIPATAADIDEFDETWEGDVDQEPVDQANEVQEDEQILSDETDDIAMHAVEESPADAFERDSFDSESGEVAVVEFGAVAAPEDLCEMCDQGDVEMHEPVQSESDAEAVYALAPAQEIEMPEIEMTLDSSQPAVSATFEEIDIQDRYAWLDAVTHGASATIAPIGGSPIPAEAKPKKATVAQAPVDDTGRGDDGVDETDDVAAEARSIEEQIGEEILELCWETSAAIESQQLQSARNNCGSARRNGEASPEPWESMSEFDVVQPVWNDEPAALPDKTPVIEADPVDECTLPLCEEAVTTESDSTASDSTVSDSTVEPTGGSDNTPILEGWDEPHVSPTVLSSADEDREESSGRRYGRLFSRLRRQSTQRR